MRILTISRIYPFPIDTGAKRRIGAFVCELSQRHEVTLISQNEQPINGKNHPWGEVLYPLNKAKGTSVLLDSVIKRKMYHEARFWNPEFQKGVLELLARESYDAVMVHFLATSTYLEPFLDRIAAGNHKVTPEKRPILILNQHNLDEQVWEWHVRSSKNVLRKGYARWQLKKYRQFQEVWYPRYDLVLPVSAEDLEGTKPYLGDNTEIWLAPNGVDTEYFRPVKKQPHPFPTMIFVASMDVTMNQEAVKWFSGRILPRILETIPDARFLIVGRNPSQDVIELGENPAITVTGTVPDVREYHYQADVVVIPTVQGGGTKHKTLEAMALGMPIVSTSNGVQGLGLWDGRHFFLADNEKDFATHTITLLQDHQTAATLGREARAFVSQNYEWGQIISGVEQKMVALLESRRQ